MNTKAKSTLPLKFMIAEYDYEPQGRQELELKVGDRIEVILVSFFYENA